MTLISLTVNFGYPVLMADLLLSSTEGSGMSVPTYVDGTDELFSGMIRKPVGLSQKLYVINDRLALALGGGLDQMRTFLNRIQALYGDVSFDDNDLRNYIHTYPQEDSDRLFAIIIRAKMNGDIPKYEVLTLGTIYQTESKTYGKVFGGGSGAQSFLKFVNLAMAMRTDIKKTDPYYTDVPLSANLSAIGYFLSSEMLDGKTLKDLYGAGFEMIIFEGGKFVKLKEYTLVVMWAQFGKQIEFNASPVRTMLFNYEDDALVIRAIDNIRERVFAIGAINDDRKSIQAKLNDPEHKILMVAYLYNDVDSDGHVFHGVNVIPRNINKRNETPIVFFRDDRGKLLIGTDTAHDKDFFERFRVGLRAFNKDWMK